MQLGRLTKQLTIRETESKQIQNNKKTPKKTTIGRANSELGGEALGE